MGAEPLQTHPYWLRDVDMSQVVLEPQVTWSERFVAQIASQASEATSFQEAARMLIQQGIWIREREPGAKPEAIGVPVSVDDDPPDEQHIWYPDLSFDDGLLTCKIRMTRNQVSSLAAAVPTAINFQEAIWLAVSLALDARAA